MHSWIGYEIVRVLLTFGLSPKLRDNLEKWSPDLYNIFTYLGNQQGDSSKNDEIQRILQILFDETEHSSYFGKLPFGKKTKFVKMRNVTIPLVILTWLQQLQEHCYSLAPTNDGLNWNDKGRYCNAPKRLEVKGHVNNMFMQLANNKGGDFYKITLFGDLKPNKMDSEKVVKSLYDWAEMILYRDNSYVQKITKSIDGKRKKKRNAKQSMPQYTMSSVNYKSNDGNNTMNIEINNTTPQQVRHKTTEKLMATVSDFMQINIEKIKKTTDKKRQTRKT